MAPKKISLAAWKALPDDRKRLPPAASDKPQVLWHGEWIDVRIVKGKGS